MDMFYYPDPIPNSVVLGASFAFNFIGSILAIVTMLISMRSAREFIGRRLISLPMIGLFAFILYISNAGILGHLLNGGTPGRGILRLSLFTALMQAIIETLCLIAIAGIVNAAAKYRIRSYDRSGLMITVLAITTFGLACTFFTAWAFQIRCANDYLGECWFSHFFTIKRSLFAHCIIHATACLVLIILAINALLSSPSAMASLSFSTLALTLWFFDSLLMAIHYGIEVFDTYPLDTGTSRYLGATSVLHVILPTVAIVTMALASDAATHLDSSEVPRRTNEYDDEEAPQRRAIDRNDTPRYPRDSTREQSTKELAGEPPREQTRESGRDSSRDVQRDQARA